MVPALIKVVQFLNPVIVGLSKFASANPQITAVAVAVAALASAFVLAAPFILATITVLGKMAVIGKMAAGLAATIAGWAGVVVPVFVAVKAGALGVLAAIAGWAGVIGPAIAALKAIIATAAAVVAGFITWPVIIGVALVAAAVAIYTFRDQIGAFFKWLGGIAAEGWRRFTEAAGNAFRWLIDQIVALPGRVANGAKAIGNAIGNGIANAVKSIFRGMLQWMANGINGIARQINRLIRTYNKLPGPDIGELGMVSVPRFAQGGYVTSPTLGLVGEAGREYIVPEGKAAGFANNIMAGRRGAAAIPAGNSSSGGGGAVNINITTGPVRQDASGQRWMTIEDGEKMVRQAVGQMQRTSRTPGGRYSAGVR